MDSSFWCVLVKSKITNESNWLKAVRKRQKQSDVQTVSKANLRKMC